MEYSEDAGSSDHLSFSDDHYQSVTISDDDLEVIHTSQDKAENIDYAYLEQLVHALSDFLIAKKNHPAFFRSYKILNQDQDYYTEEQFQLMQKEAERQLAQLKLGQYKYFIHPITFASQPIYKFQANFEIASEFEELLQDLKLPEQVAGYLFQRADVSFSNLYDRLEKAPELDVIYTVEDLTAKDITTLALQYTGGEHGIAVHLYSLRGDVGYDMNYSSASVKVEEHKALEGYSYYMEYYPEDENSLTYMRKIEIDGQVFYVRIYELIRQEDHVNYRRNSPYADKERLVELAQSIPLEEMIRELGLL